MFIWNYTGELNAKRVRERYLQSVLKQEVGHALVFLLRLSRLPISTTLELVKLRLEYKPIVT
jgi:hypothetical protein